MTSGAFQRTLSSDIELHTTLKYVYIREVFALQVVSMFARDRVRQALARFPWDVALDCWHAEVAVRCIEELCNASANIRSLSLLSGPQYPRPSQRVIMRNKRRPRRHRKEFNAERYDNTTFLLEAAESHNAKAFRVISSLMSVDINPSDREGRGGGTLLHRVLASPVAEDGEIAKVILAHPDVDVNVRTEVIRFDCTERTGGDTPLHIAVRKRNLEAVKMLLSREEVDVNVSNAAYDKPIALAVGDEEIFRLLFDHKDVNINSYQGYGLILELAVEGTAAASPEIVRMLATHERLDVHTLSYDRDSSPVLVWAGGMANPHLMELLLARDDTDVNATGDRGNTALHKCLLYFTRVRQNSQKVLKLLLSQKDINVDVRNEDGKTPASIAKERGISELYEQLLLEYELHQQIPIPAPITDASRSSANTGSSKCCIIM